MTLTRSVAFKPLRYSAVFLATLCILFGQSIDVAGELVARWEFNEGKGNTVKDSSGKGHDGVGIHSGYLVLRAVHWRLMVMTMLPLMLGLQKRVLQISRLRLG